MRFTELVHKVVTCSSFTAGVAAKEKKAPYVEKKASVNADSPAVTPVAKSAAAGGSASKPPWKGKVAAVKKAPSPTDEKA